MSDGKNGFSNFEEFDFKPIGKAIKKAREARTLHGNNSRKLSIMLPATYRQWKMTDKA